MSFESVDIPPKNPPVDEQTIENSLVLLAVPDLDQANVLKCVTYLRQVLSEKSPPISKTIELGGIPLLLHVVTRFTLENPKIAFEASWALTNLASGTPEHTKAVFEAGAMDVFVDILRKSRDTLLLEQSVWTLANIGGDSVNYRNKVIDSGAVPLVVNLCTEMKDLAFLRSATWMLSNCVRGQPKPPQESKVRCIVPIMKLMLEVSDDDILTDASWSCYYISEIDPKLAIDASLHKAMFQVLKSSKTNTVLCALLKAYAVIAMDDRYRNMIIEDPEFMSLLQEILSTKSGNVPEKAAHVVRCFTFASSKEMELVLPLIHIMIETRLPMRLASTRDSKQKEIDAVILTVTAMLSSCSRDQLMATMNRERARQVLFEAFEKVNTSIARPCLDVIFNVLMESKLITLTEFNQLKKKRLPEEFCVIKGAQCERYSMYEIEELVRRKPVLKDFMKLKLVQANILLPQAGRYRNYMMINYLKNIGCEVHRELVEDMKDDVRNLMREDIFEEGFDNVQAVQMYTFCSLACITALRSFYGEKYLKLNEEDSLKFWISRFVDMYGYEVASLFSLQLMNIEDKERILCFLMCTKRLGYKLGKDILLQILKPDFR